MTAVRGRDDDARSPALRRPWIRSGLAAILFPLLLGDSAPASAQADASASWRFSDDAFTDLWFHGLDVVGFHGFGPMPLYDPSYALTVQAEGREAGRPRSPLERDRGAFLAAFQGDEAFEVLHFVPLYFVGASRSDAMDALRAVAAAPSGVPATSGPGTSTGVRAVAALLPRPTQRQVLGRFLAALEEEWRQVVEPRRRTTAAARTAALETLRSVWARRYAPALDEYLEREGLNRVVVLVTPALGAEGRYAPGPPAAGADHVVAVGLPEGDPTSTAQAALSSLVREICFPAVRRAFTPFEGRFRDRLEASRASDRTATRCGELLLEAKAPRELPAYLARFGLSGGKADRAFLTAPGGGAGNAALEAELEAALRRSLHLDTGGLP